jgi:surface antigen
MRASDFTRLFCIALLALTVLSPNKVSAQWRYMFPSGTAMTDEDMRIQRDAILRLVRAEPPPIGQNEDWSNPRTGARGTVTLLGASEVRRMPCRRLRFQVNTHRASEPVDMTFTLCRTDEGVWKIG